MGSDIGIAKYLMVSLRFGLNCAVAPCSSSDFYPIAVSNGSLSEISRLIARTIVNECFMCSLTLVSRDNLDKNCSYGSPIANWFRTHVSVGSVVVRYLLLSSFWVAFIAVPPCFLRSSSSNSRRMQWAMAAHRC